MSRTIPPEDIIATPEGMHLQDRLNGLLHLTSATGAQHFDQDLNLLQIERRIVSLVGAVKAATFTDLVKLTGQQRAQVSRSLKSLLAAGILDRASVRSQVRLSAKGQAMFDSIMAMTAWRDDRLTRGINASLRASFVGQTVALIDRAAKLVTASTQTQAVGSGPLPSEDGGEDNSDSDEMVEDVRSPIIPGNQLIIPPITTLSVYLNRAATIFAKRAAGIPYFDAHLLGFIGNHDPITQFRLTRLALSKKSQVVRALAQLEDGRWIEREKVSGRRDILIYPTANGRMLWNELASEHARRDGMLFEDLGRFDEARYRAVVELLIQNARDLVKEVMPAASR